MAELFWLTERQWAVIKPLLPQVHTGPVRVDDRRIISGILFILREGCRWRALPKDYGPRTTVYNRYNRWSKRGLWQKLFVELVSAEAAPDLVMVDSSAVKAHRSASGGKGGASAGDRPQPRRTNHEDPRARRRRGSPTRAPPDRWERS